MSIIYGSMVGGGGSGGSGEAGGYYVPAVDAGGNLSWTASKADMPAVDGANIKGPKGDTGATGATGPKGDTGATGPSGANGKSAYAYAVEGGYTGTETEFSAKLAAGALIVNVTDNNGTLTANKTFREIWDAIDAGITVMVSYNDALFPFAYVANNILTFGLIITEDNGETGVVGGTYIDITQNGEVNVVAPFIEKMPNPNALTFTGAVTGSYDGSAALEVNIPSGSSSWETVIDTTLTEEAGIDTGEMPGKTEVMCLFAAPKYTKVIMQNSHSGAFGASLNGFNMAGSTYGKVGCIYGIKINGHAVQFAGTADTSSPTPIIDSTARTNVNISLVKPGSAANDIPLKLAVSLPIGTQIKVFVR